jgi:Bifunctional DNA primase/polymerase, N-terminal
MNHPFREFASLLVAAGHSPVPIVPNTKRPALAGWQRLCDAPLSPAEIERFARSPIAFGLGAALGFNGLIAIDIDTDDAAIMAAVREVLPTIAVAKRGRRGCTGFYRDPTGTIRTRHFTGLVDVLAHGTQSVIHGLHPDTGRPFQWLGTRTLLDIPINDLPVIAPEIANRIADALSPWLIQTPRPAPARPPVRPCELSQYERDRQRRYVDFILSSELSTLAGMVPNTGRNQTVFRLVCRVGRWAHHAILSMDQLKSDVLNACEVNGLVRDDGRRAVLATIESALAKSSGDALPDLGARHG